MKSLIISSIAVSMFMVISAGCTSSQGGGVSASEGFKIETPMFAPKIKQGTTEVVTIKLQRGETFKRDVTLDITSSKGISVEPTQVVIKGNEIPELNLRVKAPKDANLGEYKIFVEGTPESGTATAREITVKVVSP